MILGGGAQAKAGKKTQRLLARGKKPHQPVGQGKKLNTNSLPEAPSQIINGPPLISEPNMTISHVDLIQSIWDTR